MTQAAQLAQYGANNVGLSFKNRIINGAMTIDQRNAGASVTITNTGAVTYTLDRWLVFGSAASKFSVQQNAGSVTPPTGFGNYLGVTSLSAYTVGAGEIFVLNQNIEGFNFADMAWGTANAQPVTLSFWVRSSLTGTFGGVLRNSADNRSYPFTYIINSANTWEQKSITIVGDTTGTWVGATNGIGVRVSFGLGVGSNLSGTAGSWSGSLFQGATGATSVVGTNGATFYITGVQLEKGSTATSFDYRPYGTELALCQRYCTRYDYLTSSPVNNGYVDGAGTARCSVLLPVMRSAPTVNASAGSTFEFNNGAGNFTFTGVSFGGIGTSSCFMQLTGSSGMTTGQGGIVRAVTSANIIASAEL